MKSLPIHYQRGPAALLAATALTLASGQPAPRAAEVGAGNVDPDRLLVVDCALPAQVRRLGGSLQYLGPRRALRTTVSDCEIRGGEYVAYDRANYATALKVWQPQADSGDARAQAYVGEIYEKGLGIPPDFAKAAEWYEKAASQGDHQALTNLGYLYEQGLGVQKDVVRAMNLYRRAAGLTNDDLTFVSEVTKAKADAQLQIDELSRQLETANHSIENLQGDLDKTQGELERARGKADGARRDAAALRERISQLQLQGGGSDHSAEISELRAKLRASEDQLSARQDDLARIRATADSTARQLQARLDEAERSAAALRAQGDSTNAALQQSRLQLAAAEAKLNLTTQERQKLKAEADASLKALEADRARLAQAGKAASASTAGEVARLNAQLAEKDAESARARATIAGLDQQLQGLNAEVEKLRRAASDAAARAEQSRKAGQQAADTSSMMRAEVAAAQTLALRKQAELAAATAALEETKRQWASDHAALVTQVKDNSAKAGQAGDELKRVSASVGEREAKIVQSQAQIAGLQAELVALRKVAANAPPPVAANMRSATAPPVAAPAAAAIDWTKKIDRGTNYALIIANYEYAHLPPLKTVRQDAEALQQILTTRYGFKDHTRMISNATRKEIMNALWDLVKATHDKDSVVIYFAGHGTMDAAGSHGYWLPSDADREGITERVSDGDVTDAIATMAARHVLVIADSCYAGAMMRESTVRLVSKKPQNDEARFDMLSKLRSRTVLTSGGREPVLDSDGGEHSIFARALLNTLQKNDQVLEGVALFQALYSPVQSAASHAGKVAGTSLEQSPGYSVLADAGHQNGDFLLIPSPAT